MANGWRFRNKNLQADHGERKLARRAAKMRAGGATLQEIADHLTKQRVPRLKGRPKSNKEWTPQAASRLVAAAERKFPKYPQAK